MSEKKVPVVSMDTMRFSFDKEVAPALSIRSGDEAVFMTEDANVSKITEDTDIYDDFQKLLEVGGGCNPISGPVYIEGAKKGDYIAVEILSVKAGEERGGGNTALYPDLAPFRALFPFRTTLNPGRKSVKSTATREFSGSIKATGSSGST
jgi:hypothetical protein